MPNHAIGAGRFIDGRGFKGCLADVGWHFKDGYANYAELLCKK